MNDGKYDVPDSDNVSVGDIAAAVVANIVGWCGCAWTSLLVAVSLNGRGRGGGRFEWALPLLVSLMVTTIALVAAYRIDKSLVAGGNKRLSKFIRLIALVLTGALTTFLAAHVPR